MLCSMHTIEILFSEFLALKFHHVRLTDNPRSVHFLSIVIFIHYYRRFYTCLLSYPTIYLNTVIHNTIHYIIYIPTQKYLWRHRTKVPIICKLLHSYTSTYAWASLSYPVYYVDGRSSGNLLLSLISDDAYQHPVWHIITYKTK